ncbi:twin-arginine translocation signal domain-containing protein [Aquihabitans sp. G128]|uniref:twin-arginine translocation signal domain-containing protein n=1 Tax=Aquihabitans sp. G128 TaxID=2849779 RepID=UPI001C235ECC|nr:twin-arginine translocation signal domain-containing protein [Aquihabitans sp. G128]QXC63314.1 twin-arginine translocation signal domain-containing protein [Aquihabitans sp. G128]
MPDLEAHEIQHLLSTPADRDPGQVSRRAFLGGALATAGALSVLPPGSTGWRRRPPRSAPTRGS